MNRLIPVCTTFILILSGCGGGGGGGGNGGGGGLALNDSAPNLPIADIQAFSVVNRGEVISFDGSSSKNATSFEWTLVSKPFDSAALFANTSDQKANLVRTIIGDYEVRLIVSNGVVDSEPVFVTTTVIDAGAAPARAPIDAEVDLLTDFLIEYIPTKLNAPTTFAMVGEPQFSYYDTIGRPDQGAITINFDASNAFGVPLRTRALCPVNWDDRGYWENTLSVSFQFCFFE